MSSLGKVKFLLLVSLLSFSCEKVQVVDIVETIDTTTQTVLPHAGGAKTGNYSEQQYRHPSLTEEEFVGAINAVKKAYQLTDLSFTPLNPIKSNVGTYQANTTYKGMIYSSVKEIGTYVGSHISFHTFMTAIHNPRSRIYTDRIDEPPYHGTNCRSYYGTVCSDLVSYALGLNYGSFDFVVSDEMEELDYSDVEGFHIADVMWKSGHVALITDVVRDQNDCVVSIEVSEALQNGCKKRFVTRSVFESRIAPTFKKVFRYKRLDKNVDYEPAAEFVPVFDEVEVPFEFNDDICVDKGDRSCYFVGEEVVLNILSPGEVLEVYKDGILMSTISIESGDVRLTDLDYGLYQARLVQSDGYNDFTSWIVVDCTIEASKDEMTISFSSENSCPVSISFCDRSGSRKYPYTDILCRSFTEEEVSHGSIWIPQDKIKSDRQFFKITFETEFGKISTTPIKWL